jgi:hypothetical protein
MSRWNRIWKWVVEEGKRVREVGAWGYKWVFSFEFEVVCRWGRPRGDD